MPRFDGTAIPLALRRLDRWCHWRYEERDGKQTKRPYAEHIGSLRDPKICHPFDFVALMNPEETRVGAGFVFTGRVLDPEGYVYIAMDIDACRCPKTGDVSKWAMDLIKNEWKNTYTEVTPSGSGLRPWLRVRQVPSSMPTLFVPFEPPEGVDKRPQIQVFGCGAPQYVTITGAHLPGTGTEIEVVEDFQCLGRYTPDTNDDPSNIEMPEGRGEAPEFAVIEAGILSTKNGRSLLAADWEASGHASASEAWWDLVRLAVQFANDHGEAAANYLSFGTVWGQGDVDSIDPHKYAKPDWVRRDVLRRIGKTGHMTSTDVFGGFKADEWEPPGGESRDTGSWLAPAFELAREAQDREPLIYNLLPSVGTMVLFGESGCGKTPYAISLATRVLLGGDWFGREVERADTSVAYMIGEDEMGVADRFVAQLQADDPTMLLSDFGSRLLFSRRAGKLTEAADVKGWAEQIRAGAPSPVSLLIVDTLNANFGPQDENSTEAMTAFLQNCVALSQALRCLVVIIHHSGVGDKDRERGSSALRAGVDVSWQISRKDKAVTATSRKSKNWADPDPLLGALVPVEVRTDRKGRPITAITLTEDLSQLAAATFGEPEETADIRSILNAITANGDAPIGRRALGKVVGLSDKLMRGRLERIRELGYAEVKVATGRKGNHYKLTRKGRKARAHKGPTKGPPVFLSPCGTGGSKWALGKLPDINYPNFPP